MNEDKIFKFSDFNFTKYNGMILVQNITEWIRVYMLLKPNLSIIKTTLYRFLYETNINIDELKTLIYEQEKSDKIKNFKIKLEDNMIIFYDFKTNKNIIN